MGGVRPAAHVFATRQGRAPSKTTSAAGVFNAAVRRANENLERDGLVPLPDGLTPHKLRHTFASMLVAVGSDPVHVMSQLGHTDPAFSLRVYAHAMRHDGDERERLRALVEGTDWARMGTKVPAGGPGDVAGEGLGQEKPPPERGFREARPAGFEPATSASGGQRSIH